ncbi:multicopper oxidase family protein [Roseovarius sp. 2305UL8-3]|uniref:multicopper oxidase family protein n=1 Tax=Roseovarius conchicola TaxID=3121636 RepID=UPI00352718F9
MPTRRNFLMTTASFAVAPSLRGAKAAPTPATLTAAPARVQIAPSSYPQTDVWAYNGQVPGQTLHYEQGDVLDVRFVNQLSEGSTIHWHGLRLPNAMDGVPNMTQPPVLPGDQFDYRFALRDAGTFWYHPHANSVEQISRGLAGVLIVNEPTPPDVDRDEVLVLDDWRMTPEAGIHASFGSRHDMSHAGRLGNYITANARPDLTYEVAQGMRLRLRFVNTATARIFRLSLKGMKAWVMALDGMPLPEARPASEITIAPAQRADLIVDITDDSEALIASVEREGSFALAAFAVSGTAQPQRPAPTALPSNDLPHLALAEARTVPLLMEGGAMRGLPDGATWKGQQMGFQQLAEAGQFWAFNGRAGSGEAPFVSAGLGETIRIPITNRTAFSHAMHLHGTHFREVLPDGALGPWRDTLLVAPDEMREIAFVAENLGDWMFHCHMPSHQMAGMMNWIQVV